jgi:two-component system, OmpR family, sensor histidine kinase SenX3
MTMPGRRRQAVFFTVFGVLLIALTLALNIGWIVLSRKGILMGLGVIFFLVILGGLVMNTIFLVREIRKNEQQDAFLNAVTHELKTPVASIKLYLETLQQRPVEDAKRKEFYRIMNDDANRLLGTIEQVLEASRVGSRTSRSKQEVNLLDLIDETIGTARARHHLPDDTVTFQKKLPTGDRAIVRGDWQEIKSAVANLLDNSIKYSGGTPKVHVELERLDARRLAVRVKDNGIGIADAELKRIFSRFYRIPSAVASRVKGTGLGLFIVRSVARKHGGRVYAMSEGPGQGSTFVLELASEFGGRAA